MSQPEPRRLSVIMPVYNEAGAIVDAVEDVQRHVLDHVPGSELVVIDDGSRDATGRLLDAAASKDLRIDGTQVLEGRDQRLASSAAADLGPGSTKSRIRTTRSCRVWRRSITC